MNSPVIQLRGVSKRFGRTVALDEVSLEIPPGVVFAVLGENGAGKTTLIRILTGFLKPDAGDATLLGQNCLTAGPSIRQQIGYVADSPALYDWMDSEEIGWFTSAFYRQGFQQRYRELLAEYDVPRGIRLKHLSRGQRAKVALALATAHDPEVLVLDEPTSGLDPMVRRHFLESMVDRAALGRTVLLSSHQINEVERVADWIAILHQGTVKLVQPLDELKRSTAIVTAQLENAAITPPQLTGQILSEHRHGNQVRWVVKDLPERWRDALLEGTGILEVTKQSATLEEIFVAVCGNDSLALEGKPLDDDAGALAISN